MYIKDKQKLVSKSLFKKLLSSLYQEDFKTTATLDVVAKNVIDSYTKNSEIQNLTIEEKEKLCVYLQIGFAEPF